MASCYFSRIPSDLKMELLLHFWITEIDQLTRQIGELNYLQTDEVFWNTVYWTHLKDDTREQICRENQMELPAKKICLPSKRLTCLAIIDDFHENSHIFPTCGNILIYMISYNYLRAIPFILDSTNQLNKPYKYSTNFNTMELEVEVLPISLEHIMKLREFGWVKYLVDNKALSFAYENASFLEIVVSHLCLDEVGLDLLKYFIRTNPQMSIDEIFDNLINYIKRLMNHQGVHSGT